MGTFLLWYDTFKQSKLNALRDYAILRLGLPDDSGYGPLAKAKDWLARMIKAGMAELADAADSKSADRKVVGVRPPLPAPIKFTNKSNKMSKMDAIRGSCRVSLISDIE